MKRTPLKRRSKSPNKKYQDKIWKLCRDIAFKIYKNDCYTCGAKNLQGSNCQLGHMWAKASLSMHLKYDMRVLRWQCNTCNQYRGGMGADYYAKMLKEIGQDKMDILNKERQVLIKADSIWFENKITELEKQLSELSTD